MRRLFFLVLFLCCIVNIASASECLTGYEPPVAAFYVKEADLAKMALSEADRAAVAGKLAAFQARESELRAALRDGNAEFVMMLSVAAPDRSRADDLAVRVIGIIRELYALDIDHALDMAAALGQENLRKARVKVHRHAGHCEWSPSVPVMRQTLSGQEREMIGLQEDEQKYLADFERREKYFASEKWLLRERLDRALVGSRETDRALAKSLLEEWVAMVRQQATNRLDRYFYADQVLFSPERMGKLQELYTKHKKGKAKGK
ncbi:MAG: periplasmic heavy metal sensor [Candidatus Omnitrophica bacterium]|nr:periplasmic heavy metal sensor [Candidatus Omnitrophota bacterium]